MNYTPIYINTRVIAHRNPYTQCDGYLLQGQSGKSYNWETITYYPASQKALAELEACKKAQKYSDKISGLVTAYNVAGYGIKSYLNGTEYTR